jgi:hypothetical protein
VGCSKVFDDQVSGLASCFFFMRKGFGKYTLEICMRIRALHRYRDRGVDDL